MSKFYGRQKSFTIPKDHYFLTFTKRWLKNEKTRGCWLHIPRHKMGYHWCSEQQWEIRLLCFCLGIVGDRVLRRYHSQNEHNFMQISCRCYIHFILHKWTLALEFRVTLPLAFWSLVRYFSFVSIIKQLKLHA